MERALVGLKKIPKCPYEMLCTVTQKRQRNPHLEKGKFRGRDVKCGLFLMKSQRAGPLGEEKPAEHRGAAGGILRESGQKTPLEINYSSP